MPEIQLRFAFALPSVPELGTALVTFQGRDGGHFTREYFVGHVWKDNLVFWAQEKPVKGCRRESTAFQTFYWVEESECWGMMVPECAIRYRPCTVEFFSRMA